MQNLQKKSNTELGNVSQFRLSNVQESDHLKNNTVFEKISSKYLLIMFTTGLLMGALNGNVGVNFRYQLPVLVFVCWSLLDSASPRIEKLIKLNKPN